MFLFVRSLSDYDRNVGPQSGAGGRREGVQQSSSIQKLMLSKSFSCGFSLECNVQRAFSV